MMAIGIGVGVVVLLLVLAVVFLGDRRTPLQVMDQEDGADPLKRWARGVYSIVYGKSDPAGNGKAGCRGSLSKFWEINTPEEVRETLVELQGLPENDPAWDLIRVVIVARFAEGAELISKDESWAAIGAVRPRLQQSFVSWQDMAAAYGRAREAAGFDSENLKEARPEAEQIWRAVPFK